MVCSFVLQWTNRAAAATLAVVSCNSKSCAHSTFPHFSVCKLKKIYSYNSILTKSKKIILVPENSIPAWTNSQPLLQLIFYPPQRTLISVIWLNLYQMLLLEVYRNYMKVNAFLWLLWRYLKMKVQM